MASPELPTHFPCWVKAIYSWGGETKRDLGFIEGDLIECLNAGDGMWWMGRLRRDRRVCGLFPSNFVKILDDDFRPAPYRSSLSSSQNTSRSNSQSNGITPPSQSKSIFRKPFTAYAAAGSPNPEATARDLQTKKESSSSPVGTVAKRKTRPYSSMEKSKMGPPPVQTAKPPSPPPSMPLPVARATSRRPRSSYQGSRAPSPQPHISRAPSPQPHISRASSPQPYVSRVPSPQPYISRIPSPQPHISRAPSPQPGYQHWPRAASPQPQFVSQHFQDGSDLSPPPPPPPAHRTVYTRQNSPDLYTSNRQHFHQQGNQQNGYYQYSQEQQQQQQHHHHGYDSGYPVARTPSPAPSDTRNGGMTPSPLRDAMNDVMLSLEGMSTQNSYEEEPEEPRQPLNPWSPEAFDEMLTTSQSRSARPHTVQGLREDGNSYHDSNHQHTDVSTEMKSYVQRMESRLRQAHQEEDAAHAYLMSNNIESSPPPPPPPQKNHHGGSRPKSCYAGLEQNDFGADESDPGSSYATSHVGPGRSEAEHTLKKRKSAYELGRERLNRTFTTKSSVTTASSTAQSTSTNNSNSTQMTSQSLMSGYSAGGFSATSAGSLARRKWGRGGSIKGRPMSAMDLQRPEGGLSTVSYHSSHDSNQSNGIYDIEPDAGGLLGGFSAPVAKKRGLLGRMVDSVKTSAANARSNIASGSTSRPQSRQGFGAMSGFSSRPQSRNGNVAMSAIAGPSRPQSSAGRESGPGTTGDWVQMRRDVNRTNSLSRNERSERIEKCQMSDRPVLTPVQTLNEQVQGDEGADGQCIQDPTDIASCNFSMVDKSARFVNNLPVLVNAASLAQGYLCRPYKSDVQRLRAIFTWVTERITWEEDFEGDIDARRVIQTKRGCSEEIAVLVAEMCIAIGVHVEIIRGYLKIPGEVNLSEDLNDAAARPNHWWNAVIADGEWRILDCSLASPTNPRRSLFSSAGAQAAETWWFLARPTEICYTHVPLLPEQQHIVPPVTHEILMALPIASPPYFRNNIQMWDFDTSLLNLEGLEMAHIQLSVPDDIECIATVSARSFSRDADGDFFESGDSTTKRVLAQGDFISCDGPSGSYLPFKRYTIKAFVPVNTADPHSSSVSSMATLKIYAGRRGLMHSINSNPHALALTLPLVHVGGPNPDYEFFTRHPTPHALRHELYVVGPLCKRLVMNNTFVFTVRQHPASSNWQGVEKKEQRPGSPNPLTRPSSAMSMASISQSGSNYSNPSATSSDLSGAGNGAGTQTSAQKPAKLAVQSPSGKIMRMTRKAEPRGRNGIQTSDEDGVVKAGSTWESIIKIGERGTWRGLVLADRSARWCVWGEWECL